MKKQAGDEGIEGALQKLCLDAASHIFIFPQINFFMFPRTLWLGLNIRPVKSAYLGGSDMGELPA